MKRICVDASFVLKLLLDEPDSPRAVAHWSEWIANDSDIVAPFHLVFEVVSVLRNNVYRQIITPEAGDKALAAFLAQDIVLLHPDGLIEQGWQIAARLLAQLSMTPFIWRWVNYWIARCGRPIAAFSMPRGPNCRGSSY